MARPSRRRHETLGLGRKGVGQQCAEADSRIIIALLIVHSRQILPPRRRAWQQNIGQYLVRAFPVVFPRSCVGTRRNDVQSGLARVIARNRKEQRLFRPWRVSFVVGRYRLIGSRVLLFGRKWWLFWVGSGGKGV